MQETNPLVNSLPKVRGRYSENVPLKKTTWFRVGGPAEVVYKPASTTDLSFFLKNKPKGINLRVIGVGSNLLVRDGGVPGVTIRLGKSFNNIYVHKTDYSIDVGAGFLDRTVAMLSQSYGIAGLEFLCGIPGTIGGALRMNAGAYGTEMKDVLIHAIAMKPNGVLVTLKPEDMGFSYRHCKVPEDWIFIGAKLQGRKGDPEKIGAKITELLEQRDETQPVKSRTGGSTFANPDNTKAWQLIDEAGCRGMKVGGAQMSEMHCNFMINTGEASADDLEKLGEKVREKVKTKSGVDLRWEIQRIGKKKDDSN